MPDVTYSPTDWQDSPSSTSTPITAAALNNIEDGITQATEQANLALTTAESGGGGGGVSVAALASYGVPFIVRDTGSGIPDRPPYDGPVFVASTTTPAVGGTTAGGSATFVNDNDFWIHLG